MTFHGELQAPTNNRSNQANKMKSICQPIISLSAIHIDEKSPINFCSFNAQHVWALW